MSDVITTTRPIHVLDFMQPVRAHLLSHAVLYSLIKIDIIYYYYTYGCGRVSETTETIFKYIFADFPDSGAAFESGGHIPRSLMTTYNMYSKCIFNQSVKFLMNAAFDSFRIWNLIRNVNNRDATQIFSSPLSKVNKSAGFNRKFNLRKDTFLSINVHFSSIQRLFALDATQSHL